MRPPFPNPITSAWSGLSLRTKIIVALVASGAAIGTIWWFFGFFIGGPPRALPP